MRKILRTAVAALCCILILHIAAVTHGKPLSGNATHDSEGQSHLRQALDQPANIVFVSGEEVEEEAPDDVDDGDTITNNTSNLEKFFVTLHTTVERAKPFVLKLEQNTKGLIGKIGSLMDKATDVIGTFLIGDSFTKDEEGGENTSSSTAATATTTTTETTASPPATMEGTWLNIAENEIGEDTLCPDGFAANVNRICQRVMGYDGEALK